jgi:hypothetical protein
MSLHPWNYFLNIWDFKRTPIPKMGIHFKMCGLISSHSFAFLGVWMWLPSCTCPSPYIGFDPKVKVMTSSIQRIYSQYWMKKCIFIYFSIQVHVVITNYNHICNFIWLYQHSCIYDYTHLQLKWHVGLT